MIDLNQVSVTFTRDDGQTVDAVKDVNLSIKKGEIFGVIGYSGAGKSTLVRTINMLQRPTEGKVIVNGKDITAMDESNLRQARQKIGMIFQHFNLMEARTVADNVLFPLKYSDLSKQEKAAKVESLLELVGLADRADAYPAQLSGGQKQRVAIARALANDPDVLLCDEATSALDPKTTASILELLKNVNDQLGITIVIITHEMSVIKEICNRVAVMQNGHVIEEDSIFNIFTHAQADLTKSFIESASPTEKGINNVLAHPDLLNINANDRVVRLNFSGSSTGEPLIATLTERFSVRANILFANVEILQEIPVGTLLVSLEGDVDNVQEALDFIKASDINVYEYHNIFQESAGEA
ncbi:D-methionine transport system ATP-binding protein [Aerococcus urinaehominis]|nr:D-methionine transport system ATP-binding protein [Aerococcus urinaehominis]